MSPLGPQKSVPGSGHAFVRRVRAQWRALTGGSAIRDAERRTLVACSGGADSAALVLALSDRPIEVAHIVHDLRSKALAHADRDAVRVLAESLELPFCQASVSVRDQTGNLEANAANARYEALCELAAHRGLALIATAHHADDQLETLLLRLARGAGVAGFRGIAPVRSLGSVRLVRPMLEITRAQCRAFCTECGWVWREDATNADLSRARSAIRHTVLPALLAAEPRALKGAQRTARQMRLAAGVLEAQTARVLKEATRVGGSCTWNRCDLVDEPAGVVGGALRSAASEIMGGRCADARGSDTVLAVTRAIYDDGPHAKRFAWRGLTVTVDRQTVRIERNES
jgi:tRNA(Ile)-lysidine synthase